MNVEYWSIAALLCCLFALYCTLSKRRLASYVLYAAAIILTIVYVIAK